MTTEAELPQTFLEKKEKKKHTSVYIPPSDLNRLKRLKRMNGHSAAEMIRRFVAQGLDRELAGR